MADKSRKNITKEMVAEALIANGGMHTEAAKALGCSRSNISHHIRRHPDLQELVEDITETTIDIAEGELQKAIKAGNITAIIFYLKTKGKDRGYVQRGEITGKDGGPVKTESKLDLSKLTDQELHDLRRIAANAA